MQTSKQSEASPHSDNSTQTQGMVADPGYDKKMTSTLQPFPQPNSPPSPSSTTPKTGNMKPEPPSALQEEETGERRRYIKKGAKANLGGKKSLDVSASSPKMVTTPATPNMSPSPSTAEKVGQANDITSPSPRSKDIIETKVTGSDSGLVTTHCTAVSVPFDAAASIRAPLARAESVDDSSLSSSATPDEDLDDVTSLSDQESERRAATLDQGVYPITSPIKHRRRRFSWKLLRCGQNRPKDATSTRSKSVDKKAEDDRTPLLCSGSEDGDYLEAAASSAPHKHGHDKPRPNKQGSGEEGQLAFKSCASSKERRGERLLGQGASTRKTVDIATRQSDRSLALIARPRPLSPCASPSSKTSSRTALPNIMPGNFISASPVPPVAPVPGPSMSAGNGGEDVCTAEATAADQNVPTVCSRIAREEQGHEVTRKHPVISSSISAPLPSRRNSSTCSTPGWENKPEDSVLEIASEPSRTRTPSPSPLSSACPSPRAHSPTPRGRRRGKLYRAISRSWDNLASTCQDFVLFLRSRPRSHSYELLRSAGRRESTGRPTVCVTSLGGEEERLAPSPDAEVPPTQQFGVSLKHIHKHSGRVIPRVVEDTVEYLRVHGLQSEGIFRRSAKETLLKEVKERYNQGQSVRFEEVGDVHVPAVALKTFLKELREPLLTFNLFHPIARLSGMSVEQQIHETEKLLRALPEENYVILKYIVEFLIQVARKSDVNKMTTGNLAILFGPNLIWERGENLRSSPSADSLASNGRSSPKETRHRSHSLTAMLHNMQSSIAATFHDMTRSPTSSNPSETSSTPSEETRVRSRSFTAVQQEQQEQRQELLLKEQQQQQLQAQQQQSHGCLLLPPESPNLSLHVSRSHDSLNAMQCDVTAVEDEGGKENSQDMRDRSASLSSPADSGEGKKKKRVIRSYVKGNRENHASPKPSHKTTALGQGIADRVPPSPEHKEKNHHGFMKLFHSKSSSSQEQKNAEALTQERENSLANMANAVNVTQLMLENFDRVFTRHTTVCFTHL